MILCYAWLHAKLTKRGDILVPRCFLTVLDKVGKVGHIHGGSALFLTEYSRII